MRDIHRGGVAETTESRLLAGHDELDRYGEGRSCLRATCQCSSQTPGWMLHESAGSTLVPVPGDSDDWTEHASGRRYK